MTVREQYFSFFNDIVSTLLSSRGTMQPVRLTLPMEIEFDYTTLATSSWPNSFQFRNFTLCPPLLTSIVAKFMERNDAVKSLTACVFSHVRLSKKGMEKSGVRFLIGDQVKAASSFHFIGNSTYTSEENLKSATAGSGRWRMKKKSVKFFLYGKVVNMRKEYVIRNW